MNLSTGGAMIAGPIGVGETDRGTLRLERHGVEISFEVRGLKSGAVHVEFAGTDPALPAFQSTVERLTQGLQPIDMAA
jgi:hypothetical protein